MSCCSGFAHDQPGVLHEAIPDPAIIGADIEGLAEWVKGINKRRNWYASSVSIRGLLMINN